MKVLVINWRDIFNPEAGGAEIHIDEILKRKPADWQVDFLSASFKGSTPSQKTPAYTIHRIPSNAFFNFTFWFYWVFRFSRNHYDLIIDDISKIPLATPLLIRKTPLLGIQHHIHGKSLFQQLSYPMALYVYLMEKFLLGLYRKTPVVTVSESTFEELTSTYRYQKLCVSYNGIDLGALNKAWQQKKTEKTILLSFGRLKKYKRVDHVIRAFSRIAAVLPGAELWIIGRGDDEERLKALASELNISDRVVFHGFISDEQKAELLSQVSLGMVASEKEGWGITVIEQNAAGIPVVAYSVPGIRNSVRHGKTGLLVENGDIEKLAEKALSLLQDSARLKVFSAGAYEYSREFSWDSQAAHFYAICDSVLKNGTVPEKYIPHE